VAGPSSRSDGFGPHPGAIPVPIGCVDRFVRSISVRVAGRRPAAVLANRPAHGRDQVCSAPMVSCLAHRKAYGCKTVLSRGLNCVRAQANRS
jgi:hypothetical protein